MLLFPEPYVCLPSDPAMMDFVLPSKGLVTVEGRVAWQAVTRLGLAWGVQFTRVMPEVAEGIGQVVEAELRAAQPVRAAALPQPASAGDEAAPAWPRGSERAMPRRDRDLDEMDEITVDFVPDAPPRRRRDR